MPTFAKRTFFFPLALWLFAGSLFASDPPLIDVKTLAPNILVEMRYATPNNFTKRILYPAAVCLLCEPAARRLARVQANLEQQGLGLKVWDCYRPVSVQQKLWDVVPDPRYVADPKTGSRHNRGASVDLTLVDKNGNELPMPTGFDDFSSKAHRNFMELPPEAIGNRARLQKAMEDEGFVGIPTEWWHFDDPEWSRFSLRDEPLGSPALLTEKKVDVKQLLVVRAPRWNSTVGTLERFEKTPTGWARVGVPWTVSLGIKGLAWGRGSRTVSADGREKKEGDLTAPAGDFRLGKAYGYAGAPPAGSAWPYQQVDESWRCIDDPRSAYYNKIFSAAASDPKDWTTAEKMRRDDALYTWVINVEQNLPIKTGCGSCIFLHVWRRPESPTEGCTAMPEDKMVELLKWLKPEAEPHLIQLPDEEYAKLKKTWELP